MDGNTLLLPGSRGYLSLRFDLVAVGLVLGLEVEVLVRRSKEHLTVKLLALMPIRTESMLPSYLILIQSL